MNRKWLAVLLAVLACMVIGYVVRQATPGSPKHVAAQGFQPELDEVSPATPPVVPSAGAVSNPSGSVSNRFGDARRSKGEIMREGLSVLNHVPIVFYGKLEDQFGLPVAGADVEGHTRIYSGFKSGTAPFATRSDRNGLFVIDAGRGESLGFRQKKEGYVLATHRTSFVYSHLHADRFVPDPNRPVVIKMWKLQGAEPLARFEWRWKLPYTKEPMRVDLLTGQMVNEGGDLEITVGRPSGEISSLNQQDWSFRLTALDGGLMDSEGPDDIMFVAPADGYMPSTTLNFSTNAPNIWSFILTREWFAKLRDGQIYARVGISFRMNRTPDENMTLAIYCLANTNASRNLEGAIVK